MASRFNLFKLELLFLLPDGGLMKRVTLAMIADRLGIHKSTVFLALREHPAIAEETRRKVRETAEDMGYSRDPLLGALSARRWEKPEDQDAPIRAWIAYVYHDETDAEPPFPNRLEGAIMAGQKLGYRVEPFNTAHYPNAQRANNVLLHRGVAGLLVPAVFEQRHQPDIHWERFVAVNCGMGTFSPTYHSVLPDNFASIRVAAAKMSLEQEERPGFALIRHPYEVNETALRDAACFYEQSFWPEEKRLPICRESTNPGKFLEWFKQYEPTAVLSYSVGAYAELQRLGVRIPQDVRYASLVLPQGVEDWEDQPISGFRDYARDLGASSVDVLDKLIRSHDIGLPNRPTMLYLEPVWREGVTAGRQPVERL